MNDIGASHGGGAFWAHCNVTLVSANFVVLKAPISQTCEREDTVKTKTCFGYSQACFRYEGRTGKEHNFFNF